MHQGSCFIFGSINEHILKIEHQILRSYVPCSQSPVACEATSIVDNQLTPGGYGGNQATTEGSGQQVPLVLVASLCGSGRVSRGLALMAASCGPREGTTTGSTLFPQQDNLPRYDWN